MSSINQARQHRNTASTTTTSASEVGGEVFQGRVSEWIVASSKEAMEPQDLLRAAMYLIVFLSLFYSSYHHYWYFYSLSIYLHTLALLWVARRGIIIIMRRGRKGSDFVKHFSSLFSSSKLVYTKNTLALCMYNFAEKSSIYVYISPLFTASLIIPQKQNSAFSFYELDMMWKPQGICQSSCRVQLYKFTLLLA